VVMMESCLPDDGRFEKMGQAV
jgi:hypothetical protein